jgi:hypothetical protein
VFWASYAKHEQDPKAQSFRVPDEFNDGAEGHPSDTSLIERIYEVTLSRSIYRSTRPGIPHGNPAVRVCATLRGEISPRDSYPHARCDTRAVSTRSLWYAFSTFSSDTAATSM